MKQTYLLALSLFTFFSSAMAEQSKLCEDMASFSCAPGKYDDGTGVVQTGKDSEVIAANAFRKNQHLVKYKFTQMLEDPNNSYFRKMTLATLGLQNAPNCNSTSMADIKQCNLNAAEGLVMISARQLGINNVVDFTGIDFSNLSSVYNNNLFKNALEEFKGTLGNQQETDKNYRLVSEKMFPQIKKILIKKLSSLPIDEKARAEMIEKLQNVTLKGNDCSDDSSNLDEKFIANASYRSASQEVTVCKGYLGSEFSEFKLARTLGHELMHSLDPCNIARGPEGVGFKYSLNSDRKKKEDEYPVKGLLACLRSEKSIGARFHESSGMILPQDGKNAVAVSYGMLGGNVEGALGPPQGYQATPNGTAQAKVSLEYSFCKGDQIGESVSDWFGNDILVDYISQNHPNLTQAQWQNGISNVFRQICNRRDTSGSATFVEHPDTQGRINRLLLVNPQVREKIGCTKPHSKYIYCDAKNPDAMAKAIGPQKDRAPAPAVLMERTIPENNGGTR